VSPSQDEIDKALSELARKPSAPKLKRMTLDDIVAHVTEIAQDADAGADRFRALKMLSETEGSSIALPKVFNDQEMVDRLARLMKGAGIHCTQLAYARAFPSAKRSTALGGSRYPYANARPELIKEANKATSLKILIRNFPSLKTGRGIPKGYPSGHSVEAKMKWCQGQALKMLIEREQEDRQASHESMKGSDASIRESLGEVTYEKEFETISIEDKDVPGDPQDQSLQKS
jgi:hypothetical protein